MSDAPTGYKLLHNHMTIEPLLRLFPYDSPQFTRLNNEFRARILEEAANSDIPGLVFPKETSHGPATTSSNWTTSTA